MVRKTFIFLIFLTLFSMQPALGQDDTDAALKEKTGFSQSLNTGFLKNLNLYDKVVSYIQQEKEEAFSKEYKPPKLELNAIIILTCIDLVLSGLCLWLAMLLLLRRTKLAFKAYLWFIFILNFTWFCFLMLFKGLWKALEFLVISQQHDLEAVILDKFSFIVIIAGIVIYIWLLARTFNLNFLGALETFFTSQLFYFIFIFLLSMYVHPLGDNVLKLAKENLGIKSIIHTYFQEVNNITYGKKMFPLERLRPFHF